MGCNPSYHVPETVPINNNVLSLLHANDTGACISLIEKKGFRFDSRLNSVHDTLLHYACKKNNEELVGYILVKYPNGRNIKNFYNEKPGDLATSR